MFSVFISIFYIILYTYSWLSLSRPRLSRITAYLEVKIWFLPKHKNLTTGKKYCGKEEKLLLRSNFSSFHNIFNISLTPGVQLHIYLLNVAVRIIFSSILQIWYVEVRISRSISESPFEFEITRVDCICILYIWSTVHSHYLDFQGNLWNTSRYAYLDISDLQNLGKKINRTTAFNKCMCNLTPEVRDILKMLWKRGESASEEHFLLFSTIFCYLL